MSRLTTRTTSELHATTIQALEPVRLNGKISDVYLQFSNSEAALQAYLQMEESLRKGSLSITELEAVKLWVSEQTGCDFCLSVHSFKAAQAGLSEEQQLAIRSGYPSGDVRIDALLTMAGTVFRTPGSVPQAMLDEARAVGLTDENLVDLMMAVSTIFFTNITNHINDTKSSLPPAPALA
ncbi:MAG: carboxymuconolactone decarboxylase family protein [Granulosicoccus sp.]